jgi:hypothetical protein
MSFTTFSNNIGIPICPMVGQTNTVNSFSNATLDAAGESISYIGKIFIPGGGSKTISAAGGGKIVWSTSISSTFLNAGTNVRVGINDVNSSGVEDGTHDVYADLVGGTDTIATLTVYSTAMEVGSKTITHGDLIAVVIEMTTRGGADSITVSAGNNASWFPHCATDTGSGPTRAASAPCCHIIFDDGTYGWFPDYYGCLITDISTLNLNSTPDEVALVFQLPFACEITQLFAHIGAIATTDDFEIILYSTPSGTPAAIDTFAFTGFYAGSTGASADTPFKVVLPTTRTLLANTEYAIAVRPTTTNNITLKSLDFGTGNAAYRAMTTLGTNWYYGSRTNQSGAFAATTTKLPYIGFNFRSIENIAGGSSVFG